MNTKQENFGLYDQCYKGSAVVNIDFYFKKYRDLINNSVFRKHYEIEEKKHSINAIANDVDEEKYELLAEYCSIENLTIDGELKKMTKITFEWLKDSPDPSVFDNIQLQTVNNTKQRSLLKTHQVQLKYRSEQPITYEPVPSDIQGILLIPETNILVLVRVYAPFTSRFRQSTGVLSKLSLNCVITIHGCQKLTELRDQITCLSDQSISVEMSKTSVRHKTENAKNVYKSGFFFIEDTFYNDFRDSTNKDNSKVIREWAETRKLGPYKTAKMEETRIDSLVLRFGFPWVYQHQGDCEHLISFSDARFVNSSDELSANCYPRLVRIKPKANRYCMTCGIYNVSWVTTSNNRLPHNPCLFCDSCFKSYNYINSKKVGSFEAYPYPYDNDLLKHQVSRSLKIKSKSSNTAIKTKFLKMDTF